MTPHIYSQADANRALVFIRPIVEEIARLATWTESTKRTAARARRQKQPTSIFDESIARANERVEDLRDELDELGVYLRDPISKGLVDFPGAIESEPGEIVALCWHLGEKRVEFWHGMRQGFSDRKPIETAKEKA